MRVPEVKYISEPQEILQLRKETGLTQEDFARLIGANTSSVSNWEAGRNRPAMTYQVIMGQWRIKLDRLARERSAEEDEVRRKAELKKMLTTMIVAGGAFALMAWMFNNDD